MIRWISKFIIIKGTGGIGKSTLMKHFFMNSLYKRELIPIFIELKDFNELEDDYDIGEIIFNKLTNLGTSLDKKYLDYALKKGCFIFLFDGYDEMVTEKRSGFLNTLDTFCDRYSDNYYIISTRPNSEFVEFQRFTVLSTCAFTKEQAISLIGRLDDDSDIKKDL